MALQTHTLTADQIAAFLGAWLQVVWLAEVA